MRGKAIRIAWHVGPGDFEELCVLREPVGSILTSRIEVEKSKLEKPT
jgi:hypothetical protein